MRALLSLVLFCLVAVLGRAENPLQWDRWDQTYDARPGETEARFVFAVRNTGTEPVTITRTATSCNCTLAAPPRTPWVIAPGAADELRVVVDLRSRRGALTKTVYLATTAGEQQLLLHVNVPPPPAIQREINQDLALADRQAVLKGDCASCHVAPAVGQYGAELFKTACLICHGAEHRASMVPDLNVPTEKRDAVYWRRWITEGKDHTLMPAFAQRLGGFLDADQIDSLVAHLMATLPTEPPPARP